MQERFEGWVRALAGGSLAIAAYAAYVAYATAPDPATRSILPMVMMGGAAVLFVFWPARMAYSY